MKKCGELEGSTEGDQRIEVISILPLWQRSVRRRKRRRRGKRDVLSPFGIERGGGVLRGEPVHPLALNYLELTEGGAEGGREESEEEE